MLDGKLLDEEGRLAALKRYEVLDTPSEKPFDKITSLVQSVLGVPISAVSLVDRERQWFKSMQGLEATETPRSVSFCSHAIRRYEPLIIPDALKDERFKSNPLVTGAPGIRSYAGVPLQTPDGYTVGALCAIDLSPRDFTKAQVDILKSFGSLVVDELELRRIADRDHLTGTLTRRGFVQLLQKEIDRFQRYERSSVLLLFDVDHFKQVNDRHGHPAGDEVLKAVSAACLKQLRSNDCMGRLGGEEFGILLAEVDSEAGFAAAEKFRQIIEGTLIGAAGGIRVTASFGVAPIGPGISKSEDWISLADQALYASKRGGRNLCTLRGCASATAAA